MPSTGRPNGSRPYIWRWRVREDMGYTTAEWRKLRGARRYWELELERYWTGERHRKFWGKAKPDGGPVNSTRG